jgi:hypothetical protein
MATQEATGNCKLCNRQVLIRRKATTHIFHFIMSLLTAGVWIIIWILCAVRIGGWRCTVCGSKASRRFFA